MNAPGLMFGPTTQRRRRRRRIATLTLFVILVYGLVDDLLTQMTLHDAQVHLALARSRLTRTSRHLVASEQTLKVINVTKAANQASLNDMSGELASTKQQLAQADQGLNLQNLSISTLDACVSGVQQAVTLLQQGAQQEAINAIRGVAGVCKTVQGANPDGPAYPFDFPDPDVVDVSGTYYAYGTNSAGGNIQIIRSTDLSHWKTVGDALPKAASWASTGYTWAPGVLRHRRRYLLYYATDDRLSLGSKRVHLCGDRSSSREVLSSTRAVHRSSVRPRWVGPSIPRRTPMATARPYLTWKSNGAGGSTRHDLVQALSPSGTAMARRTPPTVLLRPSQPWEGSVVEGPYMWTSGGPTTSSTPATTGTVRPTQSAWPMSGSPRSVHQAARRSALHVQTESRGSGRRLGVRDAQGNPWVAFHGWLPAAVGYPNARLLFVRPLGSLGALPPPLPAGSTTASPSR